MRDRHRFYALLLKQRLLAERLVQAIIYFLFSLYVCNKLSVNVLLLLVPVFSVHDGPIFKFPPFEKLSGMNALSAVGLGFLLALLIFIDQNIVISLTHVPEHKYESHFMFEF